jgi:hypothetical protein
MADNVARLIAAASALASASTMTISYATYRRVRPRLAIKAYVFAQIPVGKGCVDMCLRIRLINRGQTAIKLGDELSVRFGPRTRRRILESWSWKPARYIGLGRWRLIESLSWPWRLVDFFESWSLRQHGGHSIPLPDDVERQVEPFGAVEWNIQREWTTLGQRRPDWTNVRVELTLPAGATVRSRWMPVPYFQKEVSDADVLQLSFDDISD